MIQLTLLVLALAAWAQAMDPDPRKVQFQHVEYDTTGLIAKIEAALLKGTHPLGSQIRFRKTDACLDASLYINGTNFYVPFPNSGCLRESASQQWRLIDGRIQVGDHEHLPHLVHPDNTFGGRVTGCLDHTTNGPASELHVLDCRNDDPNQFFFVKIHNDQVDFEHNRLFFTIHPKKYGGTCLTWFLKPNNPATQMFHLDDCKGSIDQSFYLGEVDFTAEVKAIHAAVYQGR